MSRLENNTDCNELIFLFSHTVLLFTVYRNVIPNDDLKFKYIWEMILLAMETLDLNNDIMGRHAIWIVRNGGKFDDLVNVFVTTQRTCHTGICSFII